MDTFRKDYNSLSKLHSFEKQIKEKAEELEIYFKKISGREMSLAITNLEQSIMWAVKAIYKPQSTTEVNDKC